jgi:hypothetical protein
MVEFSGQEVDSLDHRSVERLCRYGGPFSRRRGARALPWADPGSAPSGSGPTDFVHHSPSKIFRCRNTRTLKAISRDKLVISRSPMACSGERQISGRRQLVSGKDSLPDTAEGWAGDFCHLAQTTSSTDADGSPRHLSELARLPARGNHHSSQAKARGVGRGDFRAVLALGHVPPREVLCPQGRAAEVLCSGW